MQTTPSSTPSTMSALASPPSALGTLATSSASPSGATDLYWSKLNALLTDAHGVITRRLRFPPGIDPVRHVGDRGRLAILLQGHSPSACDALVSSLPAATPTTSTPSENNSGDGDCVSTQTTAPAASSDSASAAVWDVSAMRQILTTQSAGRFEHYGVPTTHADWVAERLKAIAGTETPLDNVTLTVFEAEFACLPVSVVDDVLAGRKQMRKLRNRIDACVRILAAMEGRGRRVAAATLDRLKATLEKAEVAAQAGAARLAAAEAARAAKAAAKAEKEKEKEKEKDKENVDAKTEAADTPASARKAALDEKKRKARAQQNAQASFMKRFVQGKSFLSGASAGVGAGGGTEEGKTIGEGTGKTDGDIGNTDVAAAAEKEELAQRKAGKTAALPSGDRDMMSASWWMRCQMRCVGYAALDTIMKWDEMNTEGDDAVLDTSSLQSHLKSCERRRHEAQSAVHGPMRDFRRLRREHMGDRNPRFVRRRSDARGRCDGQVVKMLQFDENYRPAYYGTWRRRSTSVTGRRPLGREAKLDYEHDSEEEWDEDEDGEDLSDIEMEKDRADEDAELRKLYGSDESDDDDFESDMEDGEDGEDDDEGDEVVGEDGKVVCSQDSVQIVENAKEGEKVNTASGEAVSSCVESRKMDIEGIENVAQNGNGADVQSAEQPDKAANLCTVATGEVVQDVPKAKDGGDGGSSGGKRGLKDGAISRRRVKRRKGSLRKSVVITGPCVVATEGEGVEDAKAREILSGYAVTMRSGCGPIMMFNPYVMSAADVMGEQLKGKGGRRH